MRTESRGLSEILSLPRLNTGMMLQLIKSGKIKVLFSQM